MSRQFAKQRRGRPVCLPRIGFVYNYRGRHTGLPRIGFVYNYRGRHTGLPLRYIVRRRSEVAAATVEIERRTQPSPRRRTEDDVRRKTAAQPFDAFSKSYYTSGNLILRPLKEYHFTVGAEFIYGWQVLKDNSQGRASRVQVSLQYNLYRKPIEPASK